MPSVCCPGHRRRLVQHDETIGMAKTGNRDRKLYSLRHLYRYMPGWMSGPVGTAQKKRGGCFPLPEKSKNLHRLRILQQGMPGGQYNDEETRKSCHSRGIKHSPGINYLQPPPSACRRRTTSDCSGEQSLQCHFRKWKDMGGWYKLETWFTKQTRDIFTPLGRQSSFHHLRQRRA